MKTWQALCLTIPLLAQSGPAQEPLARLAAVAAQPSPEWANLRQLCDGVGGRVTGSPTYQRALQWGLDGFKDAGVQAHLEAFVMKNGWEAGPVTLQIQGPLGFVPKATSWGWSPPCVGDFQILDGGQGEDADLDRLGSHMKGTFVYLASRPMLTADDLFEEYFSLSHKVGRIQAMGAAGVLVQSTRPHKLLYRHLDTRIEDGAVPGIVELQIAREDGDRLARLLKDGPVEAHIQADNRVMGPTSAANVVGEIPGTDLKDEVVIIGAHLDSWELGTGAQDNGCNAAMVVELARRFKAANLHPRRTVRFILFGGEEQGFLGSKAYVKAHEATLNQVRAVLIYDEGVGRVSGFSTGGRPDWHPALRAALAPLGSAAPKDHTDDAFTGTDNYDFLVQGIPTLIANQDFTDYLPNYHAESDTLDKVDPKALQAQTDQAAVLLWGLANEPNLPKRWSRTEVHKSLEDTHMEPQMKAFGLWKGWADKSRGRN